MTYQCFSENKWIYPDTELTIFPIVAHLESARGASACTQLLTDFVLPEGAQLGIRWQTDAPITCTVYQLLPCTVTENSNEPMLTTLDYEKVKHFVTRQAPFDVYEMTVEKADGDVLAAGRAAFYLRFSVPCDCEAGDVSGQLTLTFAGETLELPLTLTVHSCTVPPLAQAAFHMNNWLKTANLKKDHHVSFPSAEYDAVLEDYLHNQLDMRNDYLMLPSGEAIKDADDKVIDFDFSEAVNMGNLALKKGFKWILGGFVARFHVWNEQEHYLLWDAPVGVTTLEGYRQLKLYFEKLWHVVNENGWLGHYQQCLVDEPQFPNSEHYRILSGICRKFLPGVAINDPVESTDLEGALEVWVAKQATYEQYIEKFRRLQEMGEEIWLYTCGFPGGYMMNRIIDLPLTVSRLPMWMCWLYAAKGFLHWGYNVHNAALEKDTC